MTVAVYLFDFNFTLKIEMLEGLWFRLRMLSLSFNEGITERCLFKLEFVRGWQAKGLYFHLFFFRIYSSNRIKR